MATRLDQADHDRMVQQLATLLAGRQCKDVRADLPGYTRPRTIVWEPTGKGCVPDVTAQDDEFRIFEVETRDSIGDGHTEGQWRLFSAYAQANDAMFYVVFPGGCADEVRRRLDELGLEAYLMEIAE